MDVFWRDGPAKSASVNGVVCAGGHAAFPRVCGDAGAGLRVTPGELGRHKGVAPALSLQQTIERYRKLDSAPVYDTLDAMGLPNKQLTLNIQPLDLIWWW